MKPFKQFMNMIPPPVKKGVGTLLAVDAGFELFNQGRKDSLTNKGVDYIAKQNNKVPFLPKAGSDPKTDIGKRISDFTSKKLDKLLNRRNQNMGASDLKGTSSGMS